MGDSIGGGGERRGSIGGKQVIYNGTRRRIIEALLASNVCSVFTHLTAAWPYEPLHPGEGWWSYTRHIRVTYASHTWLVHRSQPYPQWGSRQGFVTASPWGLGGHPPWHLILHVRRGPLFTTALGESLHPEEGRGYGEWREHTMFKEPLHLTAML